MVGNYFDLVDSIWGSGEGGEGAEKQSDGQ